MNMKFIYNFALLLLTIEEIASIISSIFYRPLSNIVLQVYPSLVLIGNLGTILQFLNCKIEFFGRTISEKTDNLIQIIYLILIFIIMIINLLFFVDDKTFDENIKILFLKEKYKLFIINGILGGLVNLIGIIYLIILIIKENKMLMKIERTSLSLERLNTRK